MGVEWAESQHPYFNISSFTELHTCWIDWLTREQVKASFLNFFQVQENWRLNPIPVLRPDSQVLIVLYPLKSKTNCEEF